MKKKYEKPEMLTYAPLPGIPTILAVGAAAAVVGAAVGAATSYAVKVFGQMEMNGRERIPNTVVL